MIFRASYWMSNAILSVRQMVALVVGEMGSVQTFSLLEEKKN
nr:hypothetical protein [Spirosoma radiotolerans]